MFQRLKFQLLSDSVVKCRSLTKHRIDRDLCINIVSFFSQINILQKKFNILRKMLYFHPRHFTTLIVRCTEIIEKIYRPAQLRLSMAGFFLKTYRYNNFQTRIVYIFHRLRCCREVCLVLSYGVSLRLYM